ncbi:MAG: thiamine ABC transporter substrate-binding protein [Acidimicrobiia bacterium]|nr:thiamine ABC transporter substrate-binding protein [Acidimicrobiia bacterium]
MTTMRVLIVIALAILVGACGGAEPPDEIVLLTHDSFAVSPGVIEQWEAETGVEVRVLQGGDAGTMVSQAVLTKDSPIADVMYGIDNTFLSRALDADIFLEYRAAGVDGVAPGLDVDNRVTPINFGDVCLNYDKAALTAAGLSVPTDLLTLADPAYAGQLVVQNPASSSPGLAFLLATIEEFPDGSAYTWRDFWADLRDNDVLVTPDWSAAYYSEFAGGGDGTRPLVVSYASSPPAGVIFSDPPPEIAPTGVVLPGCFRQVEYAAVLAGTSAPEWAESLIDWMLTNTFQEDLPLNMFVFPAIEGVSLPPEFEEHTQIPTNPASLNPASIGANREAWIEEWTEIMRG